MEAPKIFKALPVIAHLITLLGTFFLSLCGAFRLNDTGIWEVTNLVHPKPRRKAISVTPLLLSVADDAA